VLHRPSGQLRPVEHTGGDDRVPGSPLTGSLLEQQQLGGRWATLWNTLRILAELLARLGDNDEAALLLAAAEQARTAPVPFGHDAERYQRLREDLGQVLGRERLARLTGTARSLPRDEVCRLAAAALSDARPPSRR